MVSATMKSEILKRYREGKLAHAFLLETDDMDKCYEDILDLVKKLNCPYEFKDNCDQNCNICTLVDTDNLPSLIKIEPDGQFIKNEAILSMKNKFSTIPVFTKYNIYIIKGAHKFNGYSANSLLKFLEEPADNILGFLITNNKENVIPTIRSRCQIFNVEYNKTIFDKIDDEILLDVKLYLNSIFKNKNDLLYNKTNMSNFYKEREEWEVFFTTMLYYIKDCLDRERNDKIDLVRNMSNGNLVKMLVLIEKMLKYIKSNVNIDLILDTFVIEMREYYE